MPYFDPGKLYSVSWRGRPPHMLEQDLPTWEVFRQKYGSKFRGFYYDVRLSWHITEVPAMPTMMLKFYFSSFTKRIDAVGVTDREYWIIEVATQPHLRAIGQVITYKTLWDEVSTLRDMPAIMVIVGSRIDPDIIFVCEKWDIKVIQVP